MLLTQNQFRAINQNEHSGALCQKCAKCTRTISVVCGITEIVKDTKGLVYHSNCAYRNDPTPQPQIQSKPTIPLQKMVELPQFAVAQQILGENKSPSDKTSKRKFPIPEEINSSKDEIPTLEDHYPIIVQVTKKTSLKQSSTKEIIPNTIPKTIDPKTITKNPKGNVEPTKRKSDVSKEKIKQGVKEVKSEKEQKKTTLKIQIPKITKEKKTDKKELKIVSPIGNAKCEMFRGVFDKYSEPICKKFDVKLRLATIRYKPDGFGFGVTLYVMTKNLLDDKVAIGFCQEFPEVAKLICKPCDLSEIKFGQPKYDAQGFHLRLTAFALAMDENTKEILSTEEANWLKHCESKGLKKEYFGKTFNYEGELYKIIDYKASNTVRPIVAKRLNDSHEILFKPINFEFI